MCYQSRRSRLLLTCSRILCPGLRHRDPWECTRIWKDQYYKFWFLRCQVHTPQSFQNNQMTPYWQRIHWNRWFLFTSPSWCPKLSRCRPNHTMQFYPQPHWRRIRWLSSCARRMSECTSWSSYPTGTPSYPRLLLRWCLKMAGIWLSSLSRHALAESVGICLRWCRKLLPNGPLKHWQRSRQGRGCRCPRLAVCAPWRSECRRYSRNPIFWCSRLHCLWEGGGPWDEIWWNWATPCALLPTWWARLEGNSRVSKTDHHWRWQWWAS